MSRVEVGAAPTGSGAPGTLLTTFVSATLSFFAGAAPSSTAAAAPMDPFSGGGRGSVCAGAACAALGTEGLIVAPDAVLEYSWMVTDSAGPQGAADTVGRLYSALEYNGHADAGLAGVLVVARRGAGGKDGEAVEPPADAAAERVSIFSVSMESASPYLPLNVLDYVWRARAAAGAEVAAAAAGANVPAYNLALLAAAPSAPQLAVPASATPADVLATLYNAATGRFITAAHPAVRAALGAAADALPVAGSLVLPMTLLGASLGAAPGATLMAGTLLGKNETAYNLLDASSFAAMHGQRALEDALAPLALAALEAEPTFDAGLFEESNTMHGHNGLLFCNRAADDGAELPTALLGATTRWYVAVLGTEVDLHAAHWHGNTVVEAGGFRSDSIALLPRQIATVDMLAHAPGAWLYHCHITDHIEAGMMALYEAVAAPGDSAARYMPTFAGASTLLPTAPTALAKELASGRVREYFVKVEVGNWSYLSGAVGKAPVERVAGDAACGAADLAALDARYNGSFTWPKARYVRYTDKTFTQRWAPPTADEAARWAHLALLGPVLRGEVGDTIRVWLHNGAPAPFSLHPHGVVYAKGSEGAPYADGTSATRDTGDDAVQPGETWPYTWFLPEASGPAAGDPSSLPWLYHGHVHEAGDENTGLVGVLLVTRRGSARVPGSALEANLRPADVDRELIVMAKVFSEGMASAEVHAHGNLLPKPAPHSEAAEKLDDFATFFALNGLVACRLALAAQAGERVRLYGVSLGNEIDLHTLGVAGHALSFRGKRQSGLGLIPGTMYAADFVAQGGGGWLLGSSVVSHAENGMVARLDVAGSSAATAAADAAAAAATTTRDYFIAATELDWDYTPAGKDLCVSDAFKATAPDAFPPLDAAARFSADGTDLQGFSDSVRTFVERVVHANETRRRIGRRYRKARYVGFADGTFRAPLVDAHNTSTGILGPALRAAPGDVLRIVLRNDLTFPVNLAFPAAPLRLVRLRERIKGAAAWGAAIAGTPAELAARALAPGYEAEATWSVPASAGPGAADGPTIAWAYESSVSATHLYAGLAGGLIVGASPAALALGSAAHGAAREYVVAWFISNENRSPYLAFNVAGAAPRARRAAGAPAPSAAEEEEAAAFEESNLKHAVSGLLACNLGGLVATRGERVRLHLLGLGSELDMHTPQAHGCVVPARPRTPPPPPRPRRPATATLTNRPNPQPEPRATPTTVTSRRPGPRTASPPR